MRQELTSMDSNEKQLNQQTLKYFWQYAWRYKRYVIGLLIVTPLASLMWRLVPPLVVSRILERIGNGDFIRGDLWGSFGRDLLLYAGVNILGGVIIWRIAIYLMWKLEMHVQQDMHQRIFDHLMNQSAQFHASRFGGSLVSQANKFAGAYIRVADTTIFNIVTMVSALVFSIAILIPRAPYVALFFVLFSALFILVSVKITKPVRDLSAKEAAASTRQTGYLADAVTNIMAIKSFATNRFERKRYARATEKTRQATNRLMRASLFRDFIFSSFTSTLNTTALVIAAISVVWFSSDVATVFLVFSFTNVLNQYLWDFSQTALRNYNRALGDAREMTAILGLEPEIKDPERPLSAKISRGDIKLDDLTFTHHESKEPLFSHLNLHIKAGEKVGLVGHSGSGKTTLTKLLLRYVDIDKGAIMIDGQDIRAIAQEDLRSHISYVPQEPLLFHRSLAENISYGRTGASQQEIEAIAKLAHAHEFIKDLPLGYDTLVGERGVKLSGGQRQRIAIARAMLKNAPVLVLDEATSALDSESETLIQDALWKLMEGRTSLVIAHRLSTIQKMDRIIVLDNGKVVEEGTHKELIRKNGAYASLWRHQSGGFIEE